MAGDIHSAVPAVGQPWPEGRAIADRQYGEGRFTVLRHGGRSTDSWKVPWGRAGLDGHLTPSSLSPDDAMDAYRTVVLNMRQGGVVLVDPAGVVRARAWVPRLRTRW